VTTTLFGKKLLRNLQRSSEDRAYVSWVHWPWRSLASPDEMPRYRTQGRLLAVGMVLLTGAGVALGQAMRF